MRSIASGLQIQADLNCEFEGHAFTIRAIDKVIAVEVSDLMSGIRLLRELAGHGNMRANANQLSEWLVTLDSTLEFRVGGICVASSVVDYKSKVSRLLSFNGVRVRPLAALRTLLRGRRLSFTKRI